MPPININVSEAVFSETEKTRGAVTKAFGDAGGGQMFEKHVRTDQ